MPQREALLPQPPECDSASQAEIREALAGRTWHSLEREFVEQSWASFVYLAPLGYRYYLPALLIGALDASAEKSTLPHSVYYSLRPSFWSLYYQGADRPFRDRQAIFSTLQYEAVTAFLGLGFSHFAPQLTEPAAQALRWGWNRVNTPALHASRAYYHRLHTFSWSEVADPHVAALCLEVQSAFANTPYPGDDQLCGSNQGDEPAEYAMELRGLRWQSVHPELLASCSAALSFLSDAGLRYFLPAFLLSELHGYESNAEPVFYLTHDLTVSLGKPNYRVTEEDLEAVLGKERLAFLRRFEPDAGKFDWRDYAVSRFEAFTRPERLAIIRYLEHRAAIDDYDAPGIEAALAGYWRPSAAA